ncbi:MAG: type II secretion system GspH family protein [Heliobacteriaceae bacterium]|jgi:prepilin-type N-terminal cleavage/methylation domain-containing protein|nr:type II secretion system GspH family protein [Heliobacteriaceae bacterium]
MRKNGFTLAEVLITLGIIGVVAALAMPSLIQRHREKEMVTRLKKAYSVLSAAYMNAVFENGYAGDWYSVSTYTAENARITFEMFKPYLNIAKDCGTAKGCFVPDNKRDNYRMLDGSTDSSSGKGNIDYGVPYSIMLNDGMSVAFWSYGTSAFSYGPGALSAVRGVVTVDVNSGRKGPNQWGIDTFTFFLTDKGAFVPGGAAEITRADSKFPDSCSVAKNTAAACAAWVIFNENQDYLHCDDLSWDGKTKCKD